MRGRCRLMGGRSDGMVSAVGSVVGSVVVGILIAFSRQFLHTHGMACAAWIDV